MSRASLRIGFKVTFRSDDPRSRNLVRATNNPMYPLGCTPAAMTDTIDLSDKQVEHSIFQIISGFGDINSDLFTTRMGEETTFGQTVRLLHVSTGKLLCINTRARAETEKQNLKASLEVVSSPDAKHSRFRILPRYKVRSEGQKVCEGDIVVLQSLGSDWYLHLSPVAPKETNRLLEISISQLPSGFAMGFYDTATHPANTFQWPVRCGDCLQFFHRERGTLVSADTVDKMPFFVDAGADQHDAADLEAANVDGGGTDDMDVDQGGVIRSGSYPSRSLFIIEHEGSLAGGAVRFGRQRTFRLKHMASGLFVGLRPKMVETSSSPSPSSNSPFKNNSTNHQLEVAAPAPLQNVLSKSSSLGPDGLPLDDWEFIMTPDSSDPATAVCFHQASDDPGANVSHHSRVFLEFPRVHQWLATPAGVAGELATNAADTDEFGFDESGGGAGGAGGAETEAGGGAASSPNPNSNNANSPPTSGRRGRGASRHGAAAAAAAASEQVYIEEVKERLPAAYSVSHKDGLEVLKVPFSEFQKLHAVVSMIPPIEKLYSMLTVPAGAERPAAPPYLVQHVRDNLGAMLLMCTVAEETNPLTRDGLPDPNAQQRITDQRIVHLVMATIERVLDVEQLKRLSVNDIERLVVMASTSGAELLQAAASAGAAGATSELVSLAAGSGGGAAASMPIGGGGGDQQGGGRPSVSFNVEGAGGGGGASGGLAALAGAASGKKPGAAGVTIQRAALELQRTLALSFNVAQLGFRLMRQCAIRNEKVATQIQDLVPRILAYCSNPKKKVGATDALVEIFRDNLSLVDTPNDMSNVDSVIALVKDQGRGSNQALKLLRVMAECKGRGVVLNQTRMGDELLLPTCFALYPEAVRALGFDTTRAQRVIDEAAARDAAATAGDGAMASEPSAGSFAVGGSKAGPPGAFFFRLWQVLPRGGGGGNRNNNNNNNNNPTQNQIWVDVPALNHDDNNEDDSDVGEDVDGADNYNNNSNNLDNNNAPPDACGLEAFVEDYASGGGGGGGGGNSGSSRASGMSSRMSAQSADLAGGSAGAGTKLLSTQITPPGNLLQQMLLISSMCADRHERNIPLARLLYPWELLYTLTQNTNLCGELRAAAMHLIRAMYVDVAPMPDLIANAERPMFVWHEIIEGLPATNPNFDAASLERARTTAGDMEGGPTDVEYCAPADNVPQLLSLEEQGVLDETKNGPDGRAVLALLARTQAFLGAVGNLSVEDRDNNAFIDSCVTLVKACLRFGWIDASQYDDWIRVLMPILDGRNDVGPDGWSRFNAADARNFWLVSVKISCIDCYRMLAAIIRNGLVRSMVRAFAQGKLPVHLSAILDLRIRSTIHTESLKRARLAGRRNAALQAQEEAGDVSFISEICCGGLGNMVAANATPPDVDTTPFLYIAELLDVIFDCALYQEPSMIRSTLSFLLELTNVQYALYPTLTQVQLLTSPANAVFYKEMRRAYDILSPYSSAAIPSQELPNLRRLVRAVHSALQDTLSRTPRDANSPSSFPNPLGGKTPTDEEEQMASEERYNMLFQLDFHVIIANMICKVAADASSKLASVPTTAVASAAAMFKGGGGGGAASGSGGAVGAAAQKMQAESFIKLGSETLQMFLCYEKFAMRVAKDLMPCLKEFSAHLLSHPRHFGEIIRLILTSHFELCRVVGEETMENMVYALTQHPRIPLLAHLLRVIVFQARARDDGDGIIERNQRNQLRLLRVLENSAQVSYLLRPHDFFLSHRGFARLSNDLDAQVYTRDDSELVTRLELMLCVVACAQCRYSDARTMARSLFFGRSTLSALERFEKLLDRPPVVGVPFTLMFLRFFVDEPGVLSSIIDNRPLLEKIIERLRNIVASFTNEVRNNGGAGAGGDDEGSPNAHIVIDDDDGGGASGFVDLKRRSRLAQNNSFEVKCYHALLCAIPCATAIINALLVERSGGRVEPNIIALLEQIVEDAIELQDAVTTDYHVMTVADCDSDDSDIENNNQGAARRAMTPPTPSGDNSNNNNTEKPRNKPTLVAVGIAKDMRPPSSFFFLEDPTLEEVVPLRFINQVPVACVRHITALLVAATEGRLLASDVVREISEKMEFVKKIRINANDPGYAATKAAGGGGKDDNNNLNHDQNQVSGGKDESSPMTVGNQKNRQAISLQDAWDMFVQKFRSTAAGTREQTMMRTPARLMLRRGVIGHRAIKAVVRIVDMPSLSWYERTMYLHFLRQCIMIHADPFSDARLILPQLADDDGEDEHLKYERRKKMLTIDKSQEERQNIFASWRGDASLPPKLMQFLAKTNGDESSRAVLMCTRELLANGNNNVQGVIMRFFNEIQNESFFSVCRVFLLATRESLRDRLDMIDNEVVDQNLAACTNTIVAEISVDFDFSVVELLLRVVQLMCEGHFEQMQVYMLEQADNQVSINIIDPIVNLLDTMVNASHGVDFGVISLCMQTLATLTEVVQGPCTRNVRFLISQGIGAMIVTIFAERPRHLSDEDYDELRRAGITLLRSLLEGHPDVTLLQQLARSMSLTAFVTTMDECYEAWHESESEACDSQVYRSAAFWNALLHAWKCLWDPVDRVDAETVGLLDLACDLFIFMKVLLDVQNLHGAQNIAIVDRDGKSITQHFRDSTTFRRINLHVATIEILREDDMERAYFRVPKMCLTNLTELTKRRMILEVDRSSDGSRIDSFYDRCFNILDELDVYEDMRQTRGISLIMTYAAALDDLTLIIAFVINGLILGYVTWENLDTYFPDGGPLIAYQVFGGILLFLQSVLWLYMMFGDLRVHLQEQWGEWQEELNKQAVRDSKAGLSIIPPRISENSKDELGWAEVASHNLYWTLNFGPFWKQTLFLVLAYCGYFIAPFFYAIQPMAIIFRFPQLYAVVQAVLLNGYPLALTFLLLLCCIYLFAIIAFFSYSDMFADNENFGEGANCDTMLRCSVTTLLWGLRSGGGMADVSNPPLYLESNPGVWYGRVIYDLAFFVVMIVLFLNLVFGIILDTFGSLRSEKEELESDQIGKCFICGLDRDELDQEISGGFEVHIRQEHYLWNYLFFLKYILLKDSDDHNGVEGFVFKCMHERDSSWFPIGRCVTMDFKKGKFGLKSGGDGDDQQQQQQQQQQQNQQDGGGDEQKQQQEHQDDENENGDEGAGGGGGASPKNSPGAGGANSQKKLLEALQTLTQNVSQLQNSFEARLQRMEVMLNNQQQQQQQRGGGAGR